MLLETITVRTSQLETLKAHVSDLMDTLREKADLSVAVYLRNPPTTDLCIHLLRQSGPTSFTQIGVQLAAALTDYGPVDHAIWHSVESADTSLSLASNPL